MIRTVLSTGLVALMIAVVPGCAPAEDDSDAEAGEQHVESAQLGAGTEMALAKRLPSTPALDTWYTATTELEAGLASGDGRFTLEPHRGGGTSAYVEVKRDGKTIGAFLPDNSATVPLGEVRAFLLGRALGYADNVGPGVFFRLKGEGLTRFKGIMESEHYDGAKEENRVAIVKRLASSPPSLLGVFKSWEGPKPIDYDSIAKSGTPNGKMNEDDPIAKLLKTGAKPPLTDAVSLPKVANGTAPEIDLAKQLSTLMLIDALNGQWDRFSGGNMHAFVEKGVARFVTLDNGGVSTSGGGMAATYRDLILKQWVTRYDREVVAKIKAMNAFASGAAPQALGFSDPTAMRDAMMMNDKEWTAFKKVLASVSAAVETADDASFF